MYFSICARFVYYNMHIKRETIENFYFYVNRREEPPHRSLITSIDSNNFSKYFNML